MNAEHHAVIGHATRFACLALLLSTSPARAQAPADPAVQICVDAYQSTQELRLAGKLLKARKAAATCAEESCPAAVLRGCTKWLRELIDGQPSIVIVAREGDKDVVDATVHLDDEPVNDALSGRPIELDPGKHVIKLARRGHPPIERSIVVVEGAKSRPVELDLTLAASKAAAATPAPRRGAPVAGLVLGGLAVGFVGVFVALASSGARALDRLHDTCGQTRTCLDADVRAVKVKLITGDAMLAAGILSAGAAVGLTIRHFTSDLEPARAAMISWSLLPLRSGAIGALTVAY